MVSNWRERLRKLRERITGAKKEGPISKQAAVRQHPLAINLGIDFGTSFTKVCFRDVGTEETGVVTFGGRSIAGALIPSIVSIDRSGAISVGTSGRGSSGVDVRYLKMRLANLTSHDESHNINGIDLNLDVAARSLSRWYLATVIHRAQDWVLKHEAHRAKGRELQWSANVCVPVEHYDSPAIEVFNRVFAVAWMWAMENAIPQTMDQAIARYEETKRSIRQIDIDCHAIPEIAAAVQSFITSRDAQPGVYIYFDIGGGTVDGVAFNYVNRDGQKTLNLYSGKVESLGTAVLANDHNCDTADLFEKALVTNELSVDDAEQLIEWRKKLQRLVAYVVMTAKKKDGRDWLRDKFQDRTRARKILVPLDFSKLVPLIVFVGGGGARSNWYQQSILSTHTDFSHGNFGIPRYQLTEVPKPSDLDMGALEPAAFRRFAIAYGLSVPYGEGPEIRLPSQIADLEPIQRRRMKDIVEYQDIKDAFY